MTILELTAIAIPQVAMRAALCRLNALGLRASMLQPDEGPAEIAVCYLPPMAETAMAQFTRSEHETFYCRVWGASDGSIRTTDDHQNAEWTAASLDEAVSALAAFAAQHEGA